MDRRYGPLRVLKGTVAADLSATPTAIDYHLIIGSIVHEIFRHVVIIIGVASTIKFAPFPLLAGDSRQLDGRSAGS
jgi:hypothetical protein